MQENAFEKCYLENDGQFIISASMCYENDSVEPKLYQDSNSNISYKKNYIIHPGFWFHIKMPSYQYKIFHCGDKMILRSSYLLSGIFLYW